jgi:hypothetical protein
MADMILHRIFACLLQSVIALDELAQVFIRSPIYIVTGYNLPSAHETISAWVGASAALGRPWAIETARLLDDIFGKGHCARAAMIESQSQTTT